jgi:hypothetical protein
MSVYINIHINIGNWENTVILTAGNYSYPGDQYGYSITTRDNDTLLLIGLYTDVYMYACIYVYISLIYIYICI